MLSVLIILGIAFVMLFLFCCCKVASCSDEMNDSILEK